MDADDRQPSPTGWVALTVVILGFVLPTAAYVGLSIHARDNDAWWEGAGFVVFLFCLGILVLCQIIGLLLAFGSIRERVSQAAAILAVALLAVVAVFVGVAWDDIADVINKDWLN
jgi:hypothetical protein